MYLPVGFFALCIFHFCVRLPRIPGASFLNFHLFLTQPFNFFGHTITQLQSYNPQKLHSNVEIRRDLFSRRLSEVAVTDFFGQDRPVTLLDDAFVAHSLPTAHADFLRGTGEDKPNAESPSPQGGVSSGDETMLKWWSTTVGREREHPRRNGIPVTLSLPNSEFGDLSLYFAGALASLAIISFVIDRR